MAAGMDELEVDKVDTEPEFFGKVAEKQLNADDMLQVDSFKLKRRTTSIRAPPLSGEIIRAVKASKGGSSGEFDNISEGESWMRSEGMLGGGLERSDS